MINGLNSDIEIKPVDLTLKEGMFLGKIIESNFLGHMRRQNSILSSNVELNEK